MPAASPGTRAHYQDVLYEKDRAIAFGHSNYEANCEAELLSLEAEFTNLNRTPANYTKEAIRDLPGNLYTHQDDVLPGHPKRVPPTAPPNNNPRSRRGGFHKAHGTPPPRN